MTKIPNLFSFLELGIWILFVIYYLVLGIFSTQGLNYTYISDSIYLTYLWDMLLYNGGHQLIPVSHENSSQ